GKKSTQVNFQLKKLEERYYNFYIPLVGKCMRSSFKNFEETIQFHGLIFVVFLLDNLQYMTPESSKYVSDLYIYAQSIYAYETKLLSGIEITEVKKLEHSFLGKDANVKFIEFMKQCCEEATDIPQNLKLEPVTKNILKSTSLLK